MKPDYAFEFKGLAVLLPLELTEPADEADIEAITTSLDRRPGGPHLPACGASRPAPANTPPGSEWVVASSRCP